MSPISSVVSLASRENLEAIQAESGESFVLSPESVSRNVWIRLVFVYAHLLSIHIIVSIRKKKRVGLLRDVVM